MVTLFLSYNYQCTTSVDPKVEFQSVTWESVGLSQQIKNGLTTTEIGNLFLVTDTNLKQDFSIKCEIMYLT